MLKLRQLLVIPRAAKTLSLQGICHKCTSDFVMHSKTNRLHTGAHMLKKNPDTCLLFFLIHSKSYQPHTPMHAQRQSQQTHLRPMHELTKRLPQLQSAKLFSFKSIFFLLFFHILLWNESFPRLPIHKPAAVCLSLTACHVSGPKYLSINYVGRPTATWCTEERGKVLTLQGIDLLLFCPICRDVSHYFPKKKEEREQRVQMGGKMPLMTAQPHSCHRVQKCKRSRGKIL